MLVHVGFFGVIACPSGLFDGSQHAYYLAGAIILASAGAHNLKEGIKNIL